MNRIIRKYRKRDIEIHSSRKPILIKWILGILFIILISIFSGYRLELLDKISIFIIMIILYGFYLYRYNWSLKTQNNILYVRKGIFKYKIPYKDLIDIKERYTFGYSRAYRKRFYLEIEYKKGNNIKSIKVDYLIKGYLRFEYCSKIEIAELINIFLRGGELIEGKKEKNILFTEYKNIRTEQEEKEIDDLLYKRQKIEEKIIWLLIFVLIIAFIASFGFVLTYRD